MAKAKIRQIKKAAKEAAKKSLVDEIDEETKEEKKEFIRIPFTPEFVVSTGSTLLDLSISGGRIRGGGIPGGLMMEISGPSSSGKTAVLVEIGASVQHKGGTVTLGDPEARLDREYATTYGLKLPKDHYSRPDTVKEMIDQIRHWEPEPGKIHLFGADSIAQLSTEMEMGEGDKRGQRKAKELSEGCRVIARQISKSHKIVCFTNQEKQGEFGKTTPGGLAVGFQSSLRIRIARKKKVEQEKKINSGKLVKKTIGILSEATVFKNSLDDEHRIAPIYIIGGVGIDDIRANLQWYKDMTGGSKYHCIDKEYVAMDKAIQYIEGNDLEDELRELVIDLWEEIESKFKLKRKKKKRF